VFLEWDRVCVTVRWWAEEGMQAHPPTYRCLWGGKNDTSVNIILKVWQEIVV